MKYIFLLLLMLLLCSCSVKDVKYQNNGTEETENTQSTANTEMLEELEDTQSVVDTEILGENSDKANELSLEPKFEICLPNNASVGKKEKYGEQWKIDVEGYNEKEYYPYAQETTRISAGWIEIYGGAPLKTGSGYPYLPWNHCSFYNYETIDNEYVYICEVEFENYLSAECSRYNVTRKDGLSYFWCLIFVEPSSTEETTTDFVFLNQRCFSKEETMEIVETYKASWMNSTN